MVSCSFNVSEKLP